MISYEVSDKIYLREYDDGILLAALSSDGSVFLENEEIEKLIRILNDILLKETMTDD